MTKARPCAQCGTEFTPARHWQKYCRKDCKRAAERAEHERKRIAAGAVKDGKNAAAVALGKRRMELLTSDQRKALASKGGKATAKKRRKQREAQPSQKP